MLRIHSPYRNHAVLLLLAGVLLAHPARLVAQLAAPTAASANLLQNGNFTQGVDDKGQPTGWIAEGDATVDQTLSLDNDPRRGPVARLDCRAITGSGGSSHSMIAQIRTVSLKAHQLYHISFWARRQGVADNELNLAILDTNGWNAAFETSFAVGKTWQLYDFQLRSARDVPAATSRFQIWSWTAGTLWLSDVKLEAIDAPLLTYAPEIETEGRKNLIPNSSFEVGTAGWGGICELLTGMGELDELVGSIDSSTAAHGERSLKVVLNDKTTPVINVGFIGLHSDIQHDPVRMPLAANIGWIPIDKGSDYTLSAYMKADRVGTPAELAFYFGGVATAAWVPVMPVMQKVALGTQWQRYSFTLKARNDHCFIGVGPDLRGLPQTDATVWIDAVQLEKGSAATSYAPSDVVEAGINNDSHYLVAGPGPADVRGAGVAHTNARYVVDSRPLSFGVNLYNDGTMPATVTVGMHLDDFFDAPAGDKSISVLVPPKAHLLRQIPIGPVTKGFYRCTLKLTAEGVSRAGSTRLAVIEPYPYQDSFWGTNHAYPWDNQLARAHEAGLVWVRSWTPGWQAVEPKKGRFTWAAVDGQIGRLIAQHDKVDLILAYPSSNWSSSAPGPNNPAPGPPEGFRADRSRDKYMPRDLNDWGDYVEAVVKHFKGRADTFEILNEPLITSPNTYALPSDFGYTTKDYVAMLKVAYLRAKQVDPNCQIVGGVGDSVTASGIKRYTELIQAGALDYLDCLCIHMYPGLKTPESYDGGLDRLNGLMRAAGKPKPLWLTEYAYYADDEPSTRPVNFPIPMMGSEKTAAAYLVRFNAILLAHNVTKLLFHAGVGSRLNQEDIEGIYFRYGTQPRKMYTTQSAMSDLFPPDTRFVENLATPTTVRAYLFENRSGPVLVAWALSDDAPGTLALADARLRALDIQGNPLAGSRIPLTSYPIYVRGNAGMTAEQMKAGIKIGY